MDQYEIDTEGKSYTHYSVVSQKQVNWLIDLLDKSEQFDGIVLLMHQGFGNAGVGIRDSTNMNDFISLYANSYTKGYYHIGKNNPKLIPRIINAYIWGKNINGEKYSTGFEKRELEGYRARRMTFIILGSIFLTVGLILFIVFTTLMIKSVEKDPTVYPSTYFLYLFLMVISELMLDAGIVFLIIQGAVFAKKISNRERAIQEYESHQ